MAHKSPSPGRHMHTSSRAAHPDVREVLPLFIARLSARVEGLRAALAAGDMAALQDLVHQLRGAGESYGFAPITLHAAGIEDLLADSRPPVQIATAVGALIEYIENIEGYGKS